MTGRRYAGSRFASVVVTCQEEDQGSRILLGRTKYTVMEPMIYLWYVNIVLFFAVKQYSASFCEVEVLGDC